ncbi:MAG: TlpA family protein disulfide reductase [Balneolaceae bacterium]
MDSTTEDTSTAKKSTLKKNLIEWGVILGVIGILYATGLHTNVISTMQRGLLATGLIKPSIPELAEYNTFPVASNEFYFADEQGVVRSLEQFQGKTIFMNVWASWCAPCIAEMPSIQRLYDQFKDRDDLVFLMVSMDEDPERARSFMQQRDYSMPVYYFRHRDSAAYNSGMIPTTYVISPGGRLLLEKRGLAKYDTPDFIAFLDEVSSGS